MAKILDKLRSSDARKVTRLRQNYNRLQQELDSLEASLQAEKQARLDRVMAPARKQLEAAAAGNRAQAAFDAALQKYDIRTHMSRRKIHHSAVKAIFRAVREGKDYGPVLTEQKQKVAALAEKRAAYIAQLEQKKQTASAGEKPADGDAYAAQKAAYDVQLAKQEQLLAAEYESRLIRERDGLTRKLTELDARIAQIKASDRNPLTLPEDVVLRVRGLKMYFGGLKAVDDLNFDVKKGEIFGLIGPNGAGKTTVFNCITRFYDATGGEMHFANKQGDVVDLRNFQVHDVILQGIVRTFQNVEVIREVSVLDNLLIAGHRQYRSSLVAQALHLPILKKEEKLIRERAMRVLEFMGLTDYKDWYAFGLPYGVLKRIEIARTLMCNPQLIILDEPAAGLNDTETAELAQLIRRIQKEYQCTILLVEHDMGLVMDICDTVCAISFGKLLAIGTTDEVQADPNVQAAYLGTSEEG